MQSGKTDNVEFSYGINLLPPDVLREILSYLPKDIGSIRLLSRQHKALVDDMLTKPQHAIMILAALTPEKRKLFLQFFKSTTQGKQLHARPLAPLNPVEVLCRALTVQDVPDIFASQQSIHLVAEQLAARKTKEDFSLPENIALLITRLHPVSGMELIRYYRTTPAFEAIVNKFADDRTPEELMCLTLAARDVSDVPVKQLSEYANSPRVENEILTTIRNTHTMQSGLRATLGMADNLNVHDIPLKLNETFYFNLAAANINGAPVKTLQSRHLKGANLEHANLEGITLEDCTLDFANLQYANFTNAKFIHRHVPGIRTFMASTEAYDVFTTMNYADLRGANFRGVDLEKTPMAHALLLFDITAASLAELTGSLGNNLRYPHVAQAVYEDVLRLAKQEYTREEAAQKLQIVAGTRLLDHIPEIKEKLVQQINQWRTPAPLASAEPLLPPSAKK